MFLLKAELFIMSNIDWNCFLFFFLQMQTVVKSINLPPWLRMSDGGRAKPQRKWVTHWLATTRNKVSDKPNQLASGKQMVFYFQMAILILIYFVFKYFSHVHLLLFNYQKPETSSLLFVVRLDKQSNNFHRLYQVFTPILRAAESRAKLEETGDC